MGLDGCCGRRGPGAARSGTASRSLLRPPSYDTRGFLDVSRPRGQWSVHGMSPLAKGAGAAECPTPVGKPAFGRLIRLRLSRGDRCAELLERAALEAADMHLGQAELVRHLLLAAAVEEPALKDDLTSFVEAPKRGTEH